MRLLTLTLILAAAVTATASAQTSYKGGQPFLKRRPFAPVPGGEARTVVEPEAEPAPAYPYQPPQQQPRAPIYSPYSMVRYEAIPSETLPTPRPGAPVKGAPGVPTGRPDPLKPQYLPGIPEVLIPR